MNAASSSRHDLYLQRLGLSGSRAGHPGSLPELRRGLASAGERAQCDVEGRLRLCGVANATRTLPRTRWMPMRPLPMELSTEQAVSRWWNRKFGRLAK